MRVSDTKTIRLRLRRAKTLLEESTPSASNPIMEPGSNFEWLQKTYDHTYMPMEGNCRGEKNGKYFAVIWGASHTDIASLSLSTFTEWEDSMGLRLNT